MTTSDTATDVFRMISTTLTRHRLRYHANFAGIVHISITDMQSVCDENARVDEIKTGKVLRSSKVHHGYQVHIFGVRVMADQAVASGGIEMER